MTTVLSRLDKTKKIFFIFFTVGIQFGNFCQGALSPALQIFQFNYIYM